MMFNLFGKKSTRDIGLEAENAALQYLQKQGLVKVARNFQPSGKGFSDLDIVMRESDGTLVFVEVRLRSSDKFGSAFGSVTRRKQERLIKTAKIFLMHYNTMPKCRFDVVAFSGDNMLEPLWIKSAFEVVDNGS